VPAPCGVSAGAKHRHNARRSQLSVIAAGRRPGGGNHVVTARLAAHSAIQRDSPAIRVVGMNTDSSPSEPQIHPEPVGHRPIRRPDRGSGGVRLLSLLPRRRRGLLGASGDSCTTARCQTRSARYARALPSRGEAQHLGPGPVLSTGWPGFVVGSALHPRVCLLLRSG